MNKIIKCSTCGAKCEKISASCNMEPECMSGHFRLQALPQPDLTGIREVYEKYKHLDKVLSDPYLDDDFLGHIRHELWLAIREIFKEAHNVKTHHSADNS